MARNEKTSKAGATLAGRLMAMSDYHLDVWLNADPERARKAVRSLCARLLTQAPDRVIAHGHSVIRGKPLKAPKPKRSRP